MNDPRGLARGTSPFAADRHKNVPEETLEDIHTLFDLIMATNAKLRAAIRGTEVLARYTDLDLEDVAAARDHANRACREIVRLLPDRLCPTCDAQPEKTRECFTCVGKGYLSLADQGLEAL